MTSTMSLALRTRSRVSSEKATGVLYGKTFKWESFTGANRENGEETGVLWKWSKRVKKFTVSLPLCRDVIQKEPLDGVICRYFRPTRSGRPQPQDFLYRPASEKSWERHQKS